MASVINSSAFFVVAKNKPGGAERRFFYLFKYFLSKGDTPHLITNSELFDNLITENLLHRNVFKMKLNGHKFIVPLRYIFNALRYIRKKNIKHVHFCVNPSFYSFLMVNILRLMGCKTSISIVNSTLRTNSDLHPIQQIVWRKTLKSVDSIDMLSPSIRSNMFNMFGPAFFHQKKNSISVCSFSEQADLIRTEAGRDNNAKSRIYDFIFASRLIESKGLDLLLEALMLCDIDGHSFTVAICGDGPLANKVKNIKLNNIKLTYFSYVEDMQEILFLSKAALSIQKYENYPSQFLLEALAANCNIISTDVGDTRLLLNQEISSLIPNDKSILKNSLISTGYDNSPKRKAAVNFALRHHSVESFANYIEKIFAEVQK